MSTNNTIKTEFDNLAEIIKDKARGRKVVYIANPGNFGDGLIRYATKTFFNDYKIAHEEIYVGVNRPWYFLLPFMISDRLNRESYLFIYGGGGAWCNAFDDGLQLCKFLDKWKMEYLVLPSTYEKNVSALGGTLFYRDKFESKDNCESGQFCHDMAFYLTTIETTHIPFAGTQGQGLGILMRTDAESRVGKEQSLPENNRDISTLGDHFSNTDQFLRFISEYENIITDRLHVAIGGLILNKKIDLFTGSYFKIRRIYESSIRPNFKDIIIHDDNKALSNLLVNETDI